MDIVADEPERQSLQSLARMVAMSEVQQLFSESSSLESLSKIREEYQRKLISSETQLEAGIQAQLDEMQNASVLLSMAKEEMRQVQLKFVAINDLCKDCTVAVGDFDRITKVKNARTNIKEIIHQLEIYDAVPKRVAELRACLAENQKSLKPVFLEWIQLDAWRTRILAELSDAVTEAGRKEEDIKERAAKWEEIDSDSLLPSWSQSAEVQSRILFVLGDHFKKVEELGEMIWTVISTRLSKFLELAQFEESGSLVVALELTERLDRQDDKERQRRVMQGQQIERAEMLIPPNKYRKQALTLLETAIENRVRALLKIDSLAPDIAPEVAEKMRRREEREKRRLAGEELSDDDDEDDSDDDDEDEERVQRQVPSKIPAFIAAGNTLIADLKVIVEDVAKCFPESYNILGLYRWTLEKHLLRLLRPVWKGTFATPADKLLLIGWLDYYLQFIETLNTLYGSTVASSSEGSGTVQQIDDSKNASSKRISLRMSSYSSSKHLSFEDDHRVAATSRMREFRRNCDQMMADYIQDALPRMNKYLQAILRRNNTPEVTQGGSLRTAIPEDLLNALTQEINVVLSHGVQGQPMATFLQKAVQEVLKAYQESQSELAENKSSEVGIEWCCAFMNDYERMYDLCNTVLRSEMKRSVGSDDSRSESALSDVQDSLDRIAAGFIRGLEVGSKRIVHEMFHDLEKNGITKALFTEAWENGSLPIAATLRATFLDYFNDPEQGIRTWLGSELLFGRTVALSLSELVKLYVSKFMDQTAQFTRKQGVVSRLRQDATVFEECFSLFVDVLRHGKIRDRNDLASRLAIIRRIADVLEDSHPPNHFEEIAAEFGSFAQQAIARLLYYRGDLSFEDRENFKLYDLSEYMDSTAGPPRFDLSHLSPIKEADEFDTSTKSKLDPKRKAKLKKKMASAMANIKLSNKKKKASEEEKRLMGL